MPGHKIAGGRGGQSVDGGGRKRDDRWDRVCRKAGDQALGVDVLFADGPPKPDCGVAPSPNGLAAPGRPWLCSTPHPFTVQPRPGVGERSSLRPRIDYSGSLMVGDGAQRIGIGRLLTAGGTGPHKFIICSPIPIASRIPRRANADPVDEAARGRRSDGGRPDRHATDGLESCAARRYIDRWPDATGGPEEDRGVLWTRLALR
jgi:hypothetical protein